VAVDGVEADHLLIGNLLVALARREEAKDFQLTVGWDLGDLRKQISDALVHFEDRCSDFRRRSFTEQLSHRPDGLVGC
jgi:hypothetical protein